MVQNKNFYRRRIDDTSTTYRRQICQKLVIIYIILVYRRRIDDATSTMIKMKLIQVLKSLKSKNFK
jgi:hypothetical protein